MAAPVFKRSLVSLPRQAVTRANCASTDSTLRDLKVWRHVGDYGAPTCAAVRIGSAVYLTVATPQARVL